MHPSDRYEYFACRQDCEPKLSPAKDEPKEEIQKVEVTGKKISNGTSKVDAKAGGGSVGRPATAGSGMRAPNRTPRVPRTGGGLKGLILQALMQAVSKPPTQNSESKNDDGLGGTNSATGDPSDDDNREKEKSRAEKRQEKIDKALKDKNLPTQGDIPYEPPKDWNPSEPLPRGNQNGIMDKDGRESSAEYRWHEYL